MQERKVLAEVELSENRKAVIMTELEKIFLPQLKPLKP